MSEIDRDLEIYFKSLEDRIANLEKKIEVMPVEKTCGNCIHFLQHYIKDDDGSFGITNCGHCVTPRIKDRKPDSKACIYWEERR